MKEYNRKTRQWEEKSTEVVPDLKTRELCLRKMPHNYILVLPDYLQPKNPDIDEVRIKIFYESEDREYEFKKKENELLKAWDIYKGFRDSKPTRYYECDVCGKKKIDY